uniref:Uncharacterized protein n=1 Tax=Tanacetum cinerariifolium TaxID=118510 RepID=A0A699Q938_TANCI|nr:hypothetical protein [Tanacetum cinerariifolium]
MGYSSTSSSNALSGPPARKSSCSASKATPFSCAYINNILSLKDSFHDLYWVDPVHSEPLLCRLVLWLGSLDWKMFGVDFELARGGVRGVIDDVDDDGNPC